MSSSEEESEASSSGSDSADSSDDESDSNESIEEEEVEDGEQGGTEVTTSVTSLQAEKSKLKPISFGLARIRKISSWMDNSALHLASIYLGYSKEKEMERAILSKLNAQKRLETQSRKQELSEEEKQKTSKKEVASTSTATMTTRTETASTNRNNNTESSNNRKTDEYSRYSFDDEYHQPIPKLMRKQLVLEAIGTLMGVEDISNIK
eukprot:g4226.t1